ncbi:MAG: dynamin family protein [Desulfobacterales bacterium]|nr:dynamin family protein [Desulfobacterales bacterium]
MTRAEKPSTTGKNSLPLAALLTEAADRVLQIGPQFTPYGKKLTELSARYSEGRFHLAVLGQFKRGKSTLLNALTGEPILPVGVVPLTAAPTFLQYGESPKISVRFQGDRPEDEFTGASTAERNAWLAGFVTEKGNPENRLGVAEITVQLPAPILSGRTVLIDTPGIGSTHLHNTRATVDFLQQCDAALFLISADPPITEVELDFLGKVKEKVPQLFFVLNKIDYLNEDELREALSFYKEVLAENADRDNRFPVFCVSARLGLEAKAAADAEGWKASGMAELESFLVDYLAKEKFNALTEAVFGRAMEIIDAALMEAGIALQALTLPQQKLEEKIALFEKSLKQAEGERRLIQDVLAGDKKRVAAFVEDRARDLAREAERFLKEIMNRGTVLHRFGQSSKAGIQQAWSDAIPDFFEQQRVALNENVKERLLECLGPHEQRLFTLTETLRRTTADLFQVAYRPLSPEDPLEIKRKPYWVLSTWNTDPLPLLKSMDQRMDGLVRRNVENIRWSMLQNLNISFAGFARKVRERLEETVAATQGAMEAAHRRRQAHDGSVEAEINRITNRIAALEASKADIAMLKSGLSPANESDEAG